MGQERRQLHDAGRQRSDALSWRLAPKCPNKRTATEFAPCIVSQMGDDNGGSFIRGYVLGGDPPRRT